MRAGPTTHSSNPPVTGLRNDPESAVLGRSNGYAIAALGRSNGSAVPKLRHSSRRAIDPSFHPSNPPVTGLKEDPESVALGRSNGRCAINPPFGAFLRVFFALFTVQNVISRTSSPAALRLTHTFAAAGHQNAAVRPPLTDRLRPTQSISPLGLPRVFEVGFASHSPLTTSHCRPLIYGTGIDFSSKRMQTKEKTFSNIR